MSARLLASYHFRTSADPVLMRENDTPQTPATLERASLGGQLSGKPTCRASATKIRREPHVEEIQRIVIPTVSKSKIPSTLSYPNR
jgi:hypothetical protein